MKHKNINLKELFQLNPNKTFLNHGSFGACPIEVFDVYQSWQKKLEEDPFKFFVYDFDELFLSAREFLAQYLHCRRENLVFITNATYAVNQVAKVLKLKEGDVILTTNQEYGACNNVWYSYCESTGVKYKKVELLLPINSVEEFLTAFEQNLDKNCKAVYFSHITSRTAQKFPAKELCNWAKSKGLIVIIDGSHAPSQIDLNLNDLNCDFYFGNLHKWLCAPKGSGFLYVNAEYQKNWSALCNGWGSGPERSMFVGTDFESSMHWEGTKDYASYLSVEAAINFQKKYDWQKVIENSFQKLEYLEDEILKITGKNSLYYQGSSFICPQMRSFELPVQENLKNFILTLEEEEKIQVLCMDWEGRHFMRVSAQAYNNEEDYEKLIQVLRKKIRK